MPVDSRKKNCFFFFYLIRDVSPLAARPQQFEARMRRGENPKKKMCNERAKYVCVL